MMKKIAICLLLILLCAGCSQNTSEEMLVPEPSAPVSSESSAAPAPSDPSKPQAQTETRLLNDLEWFRAQGTSPTGALDELAFSVQEEDGYIFDSCYRPSAWPHAQIDSRIPEYKGQGRLWELFISHPAMSNRPSDIRALVLGFYDYDEEELQSYIDSLADFGFEEADIPEFSDTVAQQGGTTQGFESSDCFLHISSNSDSQGKYVTFSLSFPESQLYSLETSPTTETRLQNYEQWCESHHLSPDSFVKMDTLAGQFKDDKDRDNYIIQYPSQWPKHILGDLFPEFTGEGMMEYYQATNLAEFPGDENTIILSLFISEFHQEDIDAYYEALEAYGFHYISSSGPPSEKSDSFRTYGMPGYRVVTTTHHTQFGETLRYQMTFWFDARYYQQTGIA